jgi:hypothetical protein
MNDYADTDIHFSTSWVIEQISLQAAARQAECAFLPDIVRAISQKHRRACFDAFAVAALMGEIELSSEPIGRSCFTCQDDSNVASLLVDDGLVNSKGQHLLWAKVQVRHHL